MSTILDFHVDWESEEGYGLKVFTRSKSQPLASTKFDYPLSFMTEFELGHLDFDDKAPLARIERLKAFGNKLYSKLFSPEVRNSFPKRFRFRRRFSLSPRSSCGWLRFISVSKLR